jgi:hypothetical protein
MLGATFFLIVVAVPVSQNWRETAYIVPMAIALVALVFSLNKYLQARIESRRIAKS